jgi:hypothetical protein
VVEETLKPLYNQQIGHPIKKINKEILELNDNINQVDLTDVNIVFHPTRAQYIFFSTAHGAFSKIDDILGHKAILSKYKKIQRSSCILSDHNAINLEFNNKTTAENTQII